MRAATPKRAGKGIRALTLVEMIGVLAIIAIVASFVAPSLIRQVQTATAAGEDAKLDDIAQALTNAIKATGFIPNPNLDPTTTDSAQGFGWAYLASNYTRLVGSNLISVFPGLANDTGRRLYLSTNLAGTASNGGYNRTLSNWGATFYPTNAKMYLVSASRPDFNLLLPANGPGAQGTNNTNAFPLVTALENWIKVVSNGVVAAPANLVDGWTNKGEFLHVRTIDLAPIFNEAREAQKKISEQEDKNLEEIARALLASIQASGQLPDPSLVATAAGGWFAMAQSFTSLGSNNLLNSFGTNQATQRRFYLSQNATNYITTQNGGRFGTLPGGWSTNSFPLDLSFVLVSSSKEDLILNSPQSSNLGAADVAWLKNWVKKTDSYGNCSANNLNILDWTNRGEFLHVRSVDLQSLFCEVQLNDTAAPVTVSLSGGNSYTNIPAPQTYQGTTVTFKTNTSTNLEILSIFPSQSLSGLTSRSTNSIVVTNQPVPGGSPGANLLSFNAPGAPMFSIKGLAPQVISAQSTNFFVLKGSSLDLINSTATSTNSFIIQKSSQFKFYGGSWQQIY